MAKNDIIDVYLFGHEVGRLGLDIDKRRTSFQFHPDFLQNGSLSNAIPFTGVIRKTSAVQLFSQYYTETFKGLPPQFADSLPDVFGSIIFKTWLDHNDKKDISVLEQLAYVANRGMGALEYAPIKKLPKGGPIDLLNIIQVLQEVLDLKKTTEQSQLGDKALTNIFKIGSSAGGARPKILISEHKKTGTVIPGDLEISSEYNHYLIKLAIADDSPEYPREVVEYCYYELLKEIDIHMMPSKIIDGKHFATERFDRQNGQKQHTLTATGLTGWDYKDPAVSSYENLFKLASFLKISHAEMEQLFKRMVFNVIYCNTDDHLKNHSFIYNQQKDSWSLAPAYDVTFAINPLLHFTNTSRALSINGKRNRISHADLLKIAHDFVIKNPDGIIKTVQTQKARLLELFQRHNVPSKIAKGISDRIVDLV